MRLAQRLVAPAERLRHALAGEFQRIGIVRRGRDGHRHQRRLARSPTGGADAVAPRAGGLLHEPLDTALAAHFGRWVAQLGHGVTFRARLALAAA